MSEKTEQNGNDEDDKLPPININFGKFDEDDIELIDGIVVGEHMNTVTAALKSIDSPWSSMNEDEQGKALKMIQKESERFIVKLVRHMAGRDWDSMAVNIDGITNAGKGVIQAKVSVNALDKHRHLLMDSVNDYGVLVFVDPTDFIESDTIPKADPDQPELGIE